MQHEAFELHAEHIPMAFEDANIAASDEVKKLVEEVIAALDSGVLRVATYDEATNAWTTHAWIKQAVLLFIRQRANITMELPPYEYRDKLPLKTGYEKASVRVVPPGTARYGSYLAPGVVLLPGYVNIGAYVGRGTMIDTWATVGSCAQIGADVHLSGGVGIGGVIEPAAATPVIIEDGAFIGSRAIVVEGVRVEREAVIGANVVLTSSTAIIDVSGDTPVEYRGRVPARSVVIPGTRPKKFPAGEYGVSCALIIGKRNANTDRKTSLDATLRDYGVQA